MTANDAAWSGGRTVSLTEWGEYEPCGGWDYTMRFNRWLHCDLRVSERRRRPAGFTGILVYGSHRQVICGGRCRSIRAAQGETYAALSKPGLVAELWGEACSRQRAIVVFRRCSDTYVAFCHIFGCFRGYLFGRDVLDIGIGKYLKVHPDESVRSVHVDGCGEVSGPPSEEETAMFGDHLT